MRRLLAVLVPLVLLAACGDDDAADGPTTTVADGGEASEEQELAEAGPGSGAGDGEGLGDAVLASDLDGGGPVPGPGHTSATGRFEGELVQGTLCVDMVVSGLDSPVTEAHLHSGPAGEEGPVVADIGLPTSTAAGTSTWSDVCIGVDDDVIDDLAAAPGLANVDVHTASLPGGAVRGQLGVISIFDRTLD